MRCSIQVTFEWRLLSLTHKVHIGEHTVCKLNVIFVDVYSSAMAYAKVTMAQMSEVTESCTLCTSKVFCACVCVQCFTAHSP